MGKVDDWNVGGSSFENPRDPAFGEPALDSDALEQLSNRGDLTPLEKALSRTVTELEAEAADSALHLHAALQRITELKDERDAARAELADVWKRLDQADRNTDQAERAATELEACDCVPWLFSSKACLKCGRKAVITQEHFLRIAEQAERVDEAERAVNQLAEALGGIEVLADAYSADHEGTQAGIHFSVVAAKAEAALASVSVPPQDNDE